MSLITLGGKDPYSMLVAFVREEWIGWGGSGRVVSKDGDPSWPGPRDQRLWEAAGSPELGALSGSSDVMFGTGEVSPEPDGGHFATLPAGFDFSTLRHDPEALYETIRETQADFAHTGAVAPDPDAGAFVYITELLSTPLTPSDVRAALFQAMAYVPGVSVVSHETRPYLGTGTLAQLEKEWSSGIRVRSELLFDPQSSNVLGVQQVLLDPVDWVDAEPPFVMHRTAYSQPRIVESTMTRREQ